MFWSGLLKSRYVYAHLTYISAVFSNKLLNTTNVSNVWTRQNNLNGNYLDHSKIDS